MKGFCNGLRDGLQAMRHQLQHDCDEIDVRHSINRERCDEGYHESQTDYNKFLRKGKGNEGV